MSGSVAGAQTVPDLVTDRPDQTESTAVLSPGGIQLEAGFTLEDAPDGEDVSGPESLLRIGLGRDLELRLGWDGVLLERPADRPGRETAGDGELGLKARLLDGARDRPELSLLVGTSVPWGGEGASSGRFDPSTRLLAALPLTDRIDLGANLGIAWESGPAERGGRTTGSRALYTAALGFGLSERTGAFLEVFGTAPLSASGRPELSLDGGFTHRLTPHLQLDLAAGAGLSSAAPDWFVGVGLSLRRLGTASRN